MEAILVEIRKLVLGPQLELIWLPLPSPKSTPHKTRPIVELKPLLPQRFGKELVPEAVKKVTLTVVVPKKTKMTERESKTPKTTSSKPFLQRRNTRKKKELILDPSSEEEEAESSGDTEELEVVTSNDEPGFDEVEAKPATRPLEKKKKIKI